MEALLIVGAAVVVMTGVALSRGGIELAASGYGRAVELYVSVLPNVLLGFALAGLITVVVPADLIAHWIGDDSGPQGLAIATLAGVLTPGGPFLQFPLVASLAQGGAGVGPLAAYVTAWSCISLNRIIVWEIPLLGPSFTVARLAISVALPIVVGLAMPAVFRFVSR
jgi:uncharacterized membrane protein YraQ (UPF0718 family)